MIKLLKKISTVLIISLLFSGAFAQEVTSSEDSAATETTEATEKVNETESAVGDETETPEQTESPEQTETPETTETTETTNGSGSETSVTDADSTPDVTETVPTEDSKPAETETPEQTETPAAPVADSKPAETAAVPEENSEQSETEEEPDADSEEAEKDTPAWLDEILNSDIPFFKRLDFVFGFEPTTYVNAQKSTTSAPSPIYYPIYFGFHWPNDTFISLQPSFKFFRSYYLVNNDLVLPAEIENRTADVYSCILNIPVVFRVNFFDVTNIKAFGGLAALIRIPVLANGVNSSDSGYKGTAGDDLKYIKKWFAGGMRFLYVSAGIDWMFNLPERNMQVGPEFSVYFPIGAVISDFSIDGLMASIGLKVVF